MTPCATLCWSVGEPFWTEWAVRTKAAGEAPVIEENIRQLSGLARSKSEEVVQPFSVRYLELGPDIEERRERDLRTLSTGPLKSVTGQVGRAESVCVKAGLPHCTPMADISRFQRLRLKGKSGWVSTTTGGRNREHLCGSGSIPETWVFSQVIQDRLPEGSDEDGPLSP